MEPLCQQSPAVSESRSSSNDGPAVAVPRTATLLNKLLTGGFALVWPEDWW